jgi:hypothetical protein
MVRGSKKDRGIPLVTVRGYEHLFRKWNLLEWFKEKVLRPGGPFNRPKNKRNPCAASFHGISAASALLARVVRPGFSLRNIIRFLRAATERHGKLRKQIWQRLGTVPEAIA